MNITYKYSGRIVSSFEEVLDCYGENEFASPLRSTVPSLAFWMDTEQRLRRLCEWMCEVIPTQCEIDFEHQVSPFGGQGKASHTDIMVIWDKAAVAVEAKFTEGQYELVDTWLGDNPTQNRRDVLNGWVQAISSITGKRPDGNSLRQMTYQALHRIASVQDKHGRRKAVIYLVFRQDNRAKDYYCTMLSRIAKGFGIEGHIDFAVLSVQVTPSDEYQHLITAWKQTRQYDQQFLKRLLLTRRLMQFGDGTFKTIKEGERVGTPDAP